MLISPRSTWMFFRPAMVQIGTVLDYFRSPTHIFFIKPPITFINSSKYVVCRSLHRHDLLHSTAICRNLPLQARMLGRGTYVNVHIGNKNTHFAVFCIYPTSKEKGADIHCITAFFMLTTRFTFLMTISPISIERYNQYCLHNMARGNDFAVT